jgi:hypothetical protein
VHHFVKGESSEYVIAQLPNTGVSPANIELDELVAHPDIINADRKV